VTGERLHLVASGQPKKANREPRLWDGCPTCEIDIGVRSRTLVSVIQGPEVNAKGKIVGGRKVLVCAMCLARGKHTPHSV
jgi:hypothetical protein